MEKVKTVLLYVMTVVISTLGGALLYEHICRHIGYPPRRKDKCKNCHIRKEWKKDCSRQYPFVRKDWHPIESIINEAEAYGFDEEKAMELWKESDECFDIYIKKLEEEYDWALYGEHYE